MLNSLIQLSDLRTTHAAGNAVGYMILACRGNERYGNSKPTELQDYYQIRIFTAHVFYSEAALSYILLILMIYFI